jgi:acetylornithine deacetylase/succinyl-diaminopimelate desuccinylase-like protein
MVSALATGVPSRLGISHSREEWSSVEDIVAGIEVLLDAVLHITEHGISDPLAPMAG